MAEQWYPTKIRQRALTLTTVSLPHLAIALRQEIALLESLAEKFNILATRLVEPPEQLTDAIAQIQEQLERLVFAIEQRHCVVQAIAADQNIAPASIAGIIAATPLEQSQEFIQLQQQFARNRQTLEQARQSCQHIIVYHLQLHYHLLASLLPTSTYDAQGRMHKLSTGRSINQQG